jgi:hypothetical protein
LRENPVDSKGLGQEQRLQWLVFAVLVGAELVGRQQEVMVAVHSVLAALEPPFESDHRVAIAAFDLVHSQESG